MNIQTMPLGELGANCHIVDCGNAVCAAVDIGSSPARLLAFLEQNGLTLKAILLTHGHYDHIGGVEEVRLATGAEVYIHENDAVMLESGQANLAWQIADTPYEPVTAYTTVTDGAEISVGERVFSVMHTPGHTAGSVCYLTEDVMLSGDTLFCGSIGRTDLGGSVPQMRESLTKIRELETDYHIYSGHGAASTLETERRTNPYLRSL